MINIGVVGLGYWGPNLLRNLTSMDDVSVAICDVDYKRIRIMARQFPMIMVGTVDYDQLLSGVEAVVIATPPHTHYELAKRALLAGKHVLVEKPLTMSVETSEELVDLANKQNLVLMVGHTFLYNAAQLFDGEHIDDIKTRAAELKFLKPHLKKLQNKNRNL